MKFKREEQETTINYDATTMQWDVYTSVTGHINVLMKDDRINVREIEVLTEWEGKPTSIRFQVDVSRTSLRSFIRKPRAKTNKEPSEAQLEARQKFVKRTRQKQDEAEMILTLGK